MSIDKKYKIITTIENDAPFGSINWCTISFLTPQRIDKCKYLDVMGFKVHNGFNTYELASADAKATKEKKQDHDVYISEMGKIYAWDDATRTDEIEYENDKLNDLEKKRKENIDKLKLMRDQYKIEYEKIHANLNKEKQKSQLDKMKEKLHKKGMITKKELELMEEQNAPLNEIKEEATLREKMATEMEECWKTDYLDENEPIALKYGCISIFSPKHIGGLKILCFKVRGLFQTLEENNKRMRKLKMLYPNDRIYQFEIGKWCGFTEKDNLDQLTIFKQLNYGMKCHLDNLAIEKEEFEKRKEKLQDKTEKESNAIKTQNRAQKKREKREAAKRNKQNPQEMKDNGIVNSPANTQPNNSQPTNGKAAPSLNTEDDMAIQDLIKYLDDPEVRDRFPANKDNQHTMEVNV